MGILGKVVNEMYADEQHNRHRVDGPAVTYEDGTTEWWIHGKSLDIYQAFTAKAILTTMPIEDVMLEMGDPILAPFIKFRIEKESYRS